jgi:peptide subunit release factor 1 (eRF1)
MSNYSILKQLSTCRSQSSGTSLITYFITSADVAGITNALNKLNQEMSVSTNIKSKSVKKDVISALKAGIYRLKNYKNFDNKNGIVLFAGNAIQNQCYL